MKTIEIIRWALELSDNGTRALVEDMRDAALVQPTDAGGNHTLWLLGHMAFIEGIVTQIVSGDPNPVAHWAHLFGTGTQPKPDASLYPPFDEVLRAYRDGRARTLLLLDRVGDAGLDRKPDNVPPGFEEAMKTVGTSFLLVTLHQMVHYGQIAVARRAAGRKPLM
jgi:hypothetical protein